MIKPEANPMKSTGTAGHPSADEIAVRAHQLFQERGGEAGHDVEDWLQAERELTKNGKAILAPVSH